MQKIAQTKKSFKECLALSTQMHVLQYSSAIQWLIDWCLCHLLSYCCISASYVGTASPGKTLSHTEHRHLLAEQTTAFKPLQTRPTWLHFKTLRVQSFNTCPKKNTNLLSIAWGWFWNHMRYCIKALGNVIANTASPVYKTFAIPRLFLNSKLPVVDKPCLACMADDERSHDRQLASFLIIPD